MFAASAGEYVPGRKRPDLSEELLGGLDVEDFVVRFDHALAWARGSDDVFDEETPWSDLAYPNEPVRNPWRHVGRNDPCPCGSGKKAQKCCLANGEPPA